MQVSFDDTDTERLSCILITPVALLLSLQRGSNLLHHIEQVKNGITEKLRDEQRTNDQARLAGKELLNLRRVWNEAIFQALRDGIKKRLRAGSGEFMPIPLPDELMEMGANATAQIGLNETNAFAQCW